MLRYVKICLGCYVVVIAQGLLQLSAHRSTSHRKLDLLQEEEPTGAHPFEPGAHVAVAPASECIQNG